MKQFGKILKFELKGYLGNKVFVGITVFLVAAIAVAMFIPNIISLFKSDDGTADATDPSVMLVYAEDSNLAELVKEQNPDFIAVCGDMVNRGDPDTTKMKDVLEKLSKIAPTYCCLGNHERDNAAKFGTDFKSETNSTGAVLLDNEYIKFTKNGKSVLIGGMSDYPYYEFYTPDDDVPSRTLWEEFAEKAKNNFTILLHHQPEYIAEDAKKTDIDLIVCGHTHGGQIQLPFIGGVIAPNQGLFPKYDKGEFDLDGTKMIVCAGLSNTVFIPRINNQVEIGVVTVV